jgi:hypothetical protein
VSTFIQFYLLFALGWAGFGMGCYLCHNPNSPIWKLGRCAILNFTLWPLSIGLALWATQRKN